MPDRQGCREEDGDDSNEICDDDGSATSCKGER